MMDDQNQDRFDKIDDIFEKLEQHGRSRVVAVSALEVTTREGLSDARDLVNTPSRMALSPQPS